MIELDPWVIGLLVLGAACITLLIWAPGPLRPYRGGLIVAAVGLFAAAFGRGSKTARSSDDGASGDTEAAERAPSEPTPNEPLTDALHRSDDLLAELAHDTPSDRPFAHLSDAELAERLRRATHDD